MNKGTAIVGFFLCFLAGMGLMWGIDRSKGVAISAEGAEAGSLDHSAAPIPVTTSSTVPARAPGAAAWVRWSALTT